VFIWQTCRQWQVASVNAVITAVSFFPLSLFISLSLSLSLFLSFRSWQQLIYESGKRDEKSAMHQEAKKYGKETCGENFPQFRFRGH
jgi:hypothetical protein